MAGTPHRPLSAGTFGPGRPTSSERWPFVSWVESAYHRVMQMPRFRPLATTLAVIAALSVVPRAQDYAKDEVKRVADATTVFREIMGAGDKAIPKSILGKAEGVAVFPGVIKAGFIVAAMRGRGILSVRDEDGTWSGPAFLTLTGGSFGLQAGGQSTDLVLVISNRKGLENLVRNQFKIGGDASVAAGPVGRAAQASTDIQMRAQILSYSRARGVFAGISLNGSTIRQDADANLRFYRRKLSTSQIVFERLGDAPEPTPAWRAILDEYSK
jgi:lipid-binding SYLF domain-containing protein